MPLTISKQEVLLNNTLRLADHHREHCDGETCDISLSYLLDLLRMAGVEVPKDLVARFM